MTDRKQALIELRDRVKAGDNRFGMFQEALDSAETPYEPEYARQAYLGSLDAALALHEAVLPGWAWTIKDNGEQTLWPPQPITALENGVEVVGPTDNPARAWLIAILEALIAKEDHTND